MCVCERKAICICISSHATEPVPMAVAFRSRGHWLREVGVAARHRRTQTRHPANTSAQIDHICQGQDNSQVGSPVCQLAGSGEKHGCHSVCVKIYYIE